MKAFRLIEYGGPPNFKMSQRLFPVLEKYASEWPAQVFVARISI